MTHYLRITIEPILINDEDFLEQSEIMDMEYRGQITYDEFNSSMEKWFNKIMLSVGILEDHIMEWTVD